MPAKLSIISLGCPKNFADTESLLSQLPNIEICNANEADFIFLNTCAFLKTARKEVYDILDEFKNKRVILLGCIAGNLNEEIFEKYPQIQAVISSAHYTRIKNIFEDILNNKKIFAIAKEPETFEEVPGKLLLTNRPFAYVKIAEGCDNKCSYCLIPSLKGKYRSRKIENILKECKSLIENGIKEIVLVAQDCGCYGIDLYKQNKLSELLKKIEQIKGDFWIRLLYIYPERINQEFLTTIKNSQKIVPYLDIPLQHGDAEILKKMRRLADPEKIFKKIENIRAKIPDITLRTSFIVGFPGETEKNFKNLKTFIKKIDFDHVGVFEYSREKGTESYDLKPQLDYKIKKERKQELMLLQQKISAKKNKNQIGKTLKTLIENHDPKTETFIGRSSRFAPEIDGIIYIKSNQNLPLNSFQNIQITDTTEYDLIGSSLSKPPTTHR